MEHWEAFRVRAGLNKHEVQSIGANRGRPWWVTLDREEVGSSEEVEPVDNLRIEIRMRSTPPAECSVRKGRSTWRSLDSSAIDGH